MRLTISRVRSLPAAQTLLVAAVALLTADVLRGGVHSKTPPLVVLGVMCAMMVVRVARRWNWLVAGLILVLLLVPNDGRYTLAAHLPVQMEPYRLLVAFLIGGWLVALLVDPHVRARASAMEGPLLTLLVAALASEAVNPSRVGTTASYVIKAIWLFVCMIIAFYVIVSVVRSRSTVERLLTVIVSAGCVEAIGAMYQRRSGTNIFDQIHFLLPGFTFNGDGPAMLRGGAVRATASAGHPIELSSTMAMLLPLAAYLAISRGQRRWWFAALLLLGGSFSGGSRTGIIGLLVIAAIFIWLRPRQTLRCWPALIPALVIVHFASPGSLGGLQAAFFPQGGLLKQQTQTFVGRGGVKEDATRLSRLGPSIAEWASHNPLFGEGYGTRVTGDLPSGRPNPDDNAQVLDDQWLTTFLETGLVGFAGWWWLFGRLVRRLGKRAKIERAATQGWLPVALAASLASFAASMFTYDALAFTQATVLVFILMALASVILLLPPTRGVAPR